MYIHEETAMNYIRIYVRIIVSGMIFLFVTVLKDTSFNDIGDIFHKNVNRIYMKLSSICCYYTRIKLVKHTATWFLPELKL